MTMPTYEYRCKNCGEHIEIVQSFKDDPLKVCPNCEGELRKVFSPIGIAFKGSGFYRNDSRGSSSSTRSDSSSESKSSTSETKTSDGKPSESKTSASRSDAGRPPGSPSSPPKPTASKAPSSD